MSDRPQRRRYSLRSRSSMIIKRCLKKFLTDLRVEGISSEVVVVRSDSGGEFNQIEFEQLCRKRYLRQESSQL